MTLGYAALVALDTRAPGRVRVPLALLLSILAHWVYGAVALYLGSLVVFQVLFEPGLTHRFRDALPQSRTSPEIGAAIRRIARSTRFQALFVLAIGFGMGFWLTDLSPHHQTAYDAIPRSKWPHAWYRLVETTVELLGPDHWPLFLAAAALLAVSIDQAMERRRPWREATSLLAAALLVALFMGTRRWVEINLYDPRYFMPSVILIQGALSLLIVVPFAERLSLDWRRRLTRLVAPALLILSVAQVYGWPSVRGVRSDLDQFGAMTRDLIDADCDELAGDYWTVWPAVFHAELTRYEQHRNRRIYGATFRGQPASKYWWHSPQHSRCACVPLNDPYGENWLGAFGFHNFREVGRRPSIRILRRVDPPPQAPSSAPQ